LRECTYGYAVICRNPSLGFGVFLCLGFVDHLIYVNCMLDEEILDSLQDVSYGDMGVAKDLRVLTVLMYQCGRQCICKRLTGHMWEPLRLEEVLLRARIFRQFRILRCSVGVSCACMMKYPLINQTTSSLASVD